ncbi:MAG: polyprenyl synthetase family protein, partial [Candidatus Diapherotrites archaeon]|nr:polyprenyl synthetase family protein [Candidatus Diapherotrites archaeon]
FSDYAIPVGTGFQLQDDMLGLYGDEKKLGKPVGSDVIEGKRNLLILKALELGSETDKAIINKYLGKKDLTEEELEAVRSVVKSTGSFDFVKKEAYALVDKGVAALEGSDLQPEAKEFLRGIALYMVKRES